MMDQAGIMNLQKQFQEEAQKMQAFSDKIGKLRVPAAKLMAQVNENEMVKKELGVLDDGNALFKLMGPVLVKQELADARMNVDNRLKYLHGELARVENDMKEAQDGAENCQKKLAELSATFRKLQESFAKNAQQVYKEVVMERDSYNN